MRSLSVSLGAMVLWCGAAFGATEADATMTDAAVRFLLTQQHDNGGFGEIPGEGAGEVGITAIVAKSLAEVPPRLEEEVAPTLERAVEFLMAHQQADGSFLQGRSGIPTYRTAVVIMALAAIDRERFAEDIQRAAEWLVSAQIDEGEGLDEGDIRYGGFFYGPLGQGGQGRRGPGGADLSNTHMALAALRDAGISGDDPVFQKVVTFVRRCQNSSEINDGVGFQPSDDGGFVYNPVTRDPSETRPSYAGMTYAGLLSLSYAGVSADDPSVQAALDWIHSHYTLEENSGLGTRAEESQAGLYYYYYTFAKCLRHMDTETVDTASGERRWARDLYDALAARQREDGSFVNSNGQWWENNPVLVTAYSVSAMNFARPYLGD